MYLTIITMPLLGSIISGFFGRKIGTSGSQFITCTLVVVTTILSILAFLEVGMTSTPVSIQLFKWIDSESLNVLWSFNFDSLTVSMLIPVLIVFFFSSYIFYRLYEPWPSQSKIFQLLKFIYIYDDYTSNIR